ncbi:MAG: carboxypeptidase-like regulatory domain-containing protein [Terriglobales bacterium]
MGPWRSRQLRSVLGFTLGCALFCFALARLVSAEGPLIPSGPYRIAGTVVNAKAGSALARCRVTIIDSKNRESVKFMITGDDGRFEFRVPAGKYTLEGAKRGFIPAAYNQHEQFSTAIVTGDDLDTENLVLRLSSNAVLAGRVLDEFAEPVRNAQVMVYREEHTQGVSRTTRYRSAATDDEGRYEVTPIAEGTYFVSAKASPWYAVHPVLSGEGSNNAAAQVDSSLDVAYPTTYYGDATEAEDATPIPVRGGDRLEADIHLNPVPALHLIVHIPENNAYPRLSKMVFDGIEEFEGANIQSVGGSVYEMSGIAAGRYTIRTRDAGGQFKEAIEVNLSSGGELDLSSGRSLSQVKAAVQVEGGGSLPGEMQILLRPGKGTPKIAQVDAKGIAEFLDLTAGKYDVQASSPSQRLAVVRMATEAGAVSGHVLNVPAGASLSIALSIAGGSVTVEGYAKRNGKPVAGAMIVLVPKNAEGDRDRFRRDESDLDGSFKLRDVISGSYSVIAIEDGWDLDWAEPAVLAQYLKRGEPVEVGIRSAKEMRLADAVEVQGK